MSKKNNELPYMPVRVDRFIANYQGLTAEERGALWAIQCAMWNDGGVVPLAKLCRFAHVGRRWGVVKDAVIARLVVIDGTVSCPLVTRALVEAGIRHAAAVANAKKRWEGTSEGVKSPRSEGILNPRKPLKSHKTGYATASDPHVQNGCNDKENRASSSFSAAASSLELHGLAIVARCMAVPRPTAKRHLDGWAKAIGDDAMLLGVLESHDSARHRGPTFLRMVTEAVNRVTSSRIKGGVQRDLPLPPVLAAGGRK